MTMMMMQKLRPSLTVGTMLMAPSQPRNSAKRHLTRRIAAIANAGLSLPILRPPALSETALMVEPFPFIDDVAASLVPVR